MVKGETKWLGIKERWAEFAQKESLIQTQIFTALIRNLTPSPQKEYIFLFPPKLQHSIVKIAGVLSLLKRKEEKEGERKDVHSGVLKARMITLK